MPALKRPDLPSGPLNDLVEALHKLHLAAGQPSVRKLEDDLETAAVSHTTIHKVFAAGTLPDWGVVEVLTEAMAKRARHDKTSEVERIRGLWVRAADTRENGKSDPKPADNHTKVDGPIRRTAFMSEILPDTLYELEAVASKANITSFRVPTGFDDLDALTGYWAPGALIVVGGRPSSGKTSLMLHFATSASIRDKIPSMFVSVEEDARKIQFRILSSQTRVPIYILRTGQMTDDDWGRTARSMMSIADAPLAISSSTDLTLEQICAEAVRLSVENGLRIVCIDGLASVIGPDRENYTLALESSLRTLKALARKLEISVIVSVTANKPVQSYNRVGIDNLVGGAVVEEIADVVVLLERVDQDEPESPRAGEADLVVIKNRFGPQATITVAFQGHYSRFVDMAPTLDNYVSYAPAQHHRDASKDPWVGDTSTDPWASEKS